MGNGRSFFMVKLFGVYKEVEQTLDAEVASDENN